MTQLKPKKKAFITNSYGFASFLMEHSNLEVSILNLNDVLLVVWHDPKSSGMT